MGYVDLQERGRLEAAIRVVWSSETSEPAAEELLGLGDARERQNLLAERVEEALQLSRFAPSGS